MAKRLINLLTPESNSPTQGFTLLEITFTLGIVTILTGMGSIQIQKSQYNAQNYKYTKYFRAAYIKGNILGWSTATASTIMQDIINDYARYHRRWCYPSRKHL